jgi:hypothetical protein
VSDAPDLRDLLGDDLPDAELARLERVDALLRATPPPPEVPPGLSESVRSIASVSTLWTRRRLAGALALAATLSALFFGVGLWAGGGGSSLDAVRTVQLRATDHAPDAAGLIRLGTRDAQGNWPFELDVSGLPRLAEGGYYVLWLAKDGEYAGTCGTFTTGGGSTTLRMSASYELNGYDEWVVTAWIPGADNDHAPWLLRAPTPA